MKTVAIALNVLWTVAIIAKFIDDGFPRPDQGDYIFSIAACSAPVVTLLHFCLEGLTSWVKSARSKHVSAH